MKAQIKINPQKYLRIKVIPNSPKSEIVDISKDESGEETIKIRIHAQPEKGKANEELIRFLSKDMKIPQINFKILSGKSDRIKLIKIDGIA